MMHHNKNRRIWPYVLCAFLLLIAGVAYAGYVMVRNIQEHPAALLESNALKSVVRSQIGDENMSVFNLASDFLGFEESQTFLILFLNNTEIRPGGGFIGAYATVRIDQGRVEILKMEGTESIDRNADKTKLLKPPQILQDQLKVDTWYFRDSNWYPDFAKSAKQSLDFYKRENGVAHEEVDAIIGITTDVLESFLQKTGPITIDGITFDGLSAVATLEYEVEYGYAERGLPFTERKAIMKPLMQQILRQFGEQALRNPKEYFALIKQLADEKHVMMYALDPDLQTKVEDLGWTGEMAQVDGDYLMWVDANLAALKTDHAIQRSLERTLSPQDSGTYVGAATMHYKHTGTFDWRTTRYRTYARVFVPQGSTLASVIVSDSDGSGYTLTASEKGVDSGVEDGRQWFGTFIVVEPGHSKEVSFIYNVAPRIRDQIKNGSYTLFVQKQPGTDDPSLTLNLDFGTTITSANPAEAEEHWGDTRYMLSTDLATDRDFSVTVK